VRNDAAARWSDNPNMATRRKSQPPRQLSHHWFLKEWADHFGRVQMDAVRELGWAKATASGLWTGKQRYTQDYIDEVAAWLNIRPYELLMSPAEANSLRQLRASALRIAAEQPDPKAPSSPPAVRRTGTDD